MSGNFITAFNFAMATHHLGMILALTAVPLASTSLAASTPTISGKVIFQSHTQQAWFGSSAIALQSPTDPVFMASTWVYPPTEVIGYRPAHNKTAPAWADDTTRDLKYQTLYVSAPGVEPLTAGAVDSLAFWNLKPDGIDGVCALFGFNSAAPPDLSFGPPKTGSWHFNLTSDCTNVNLAVPFSRFALSDRGESAVAWVQGANASITLFSLEGATGALRWSRNIPCGSKADCDYFLSYGADVSPDGAWMVYDEGVVGSGAPHRIHVLSTATGEARGPPVLSPVPIPAHASLDATYILTSDDASNPSTGAFSTWRWSPLGRNYTKVGSGKAPLDSAGNGWTLSQCAFSTDPTTGETWVGLVWFDSTLLGPSVFALYNAAHPSTPVTTTHTTPLPGSDFANAGAVVDCAGDVCVAGLFTQKVGGPQPTLLVASGSAPGRVWNFTTLGSVDAVSVVRVGGNNSTYYVLTGGCQSVGVCTQPGGDVYGFEVVVSVA